MSSGFQGLVGLKACKMSQFRSLFPQKLQAIAKAKDTGIKDWLLRRKSSAFSISPQDLGPVATADVGASHGFAG